MQYYDAIIIRFMGDDGSVHNIIYLWMVVILIHESSAIPTD